MKYVIFSDAHGDHKEFDFIVDKYKNDSEVKYIFYNGDSQFKADDPSFNGLITVGGNVDFGQDFPKENLISSNEDHITFYQTHGHLTDANSGLSKMFELAKEKTADIVLYGHTHVVLAEEHEGILFINPGSISDPKGINATLGGTYVVLIANDDEFIVEYHGRSGNKIDSISKVFHRKSNL
jgi:putative phosphoesterase